MSEILPQNLEYERWVLGTALKDESRFVDIAETLCADDFSLESHRKIFRCIAEMRERGEAVDHSTVYYAFGDQAASVGGLGYLVSLDDEMPKLLNLDAYVQTVKQKSIYRKLIFASREVASRALLGDDTPDEIIESARKTLVDLADWRGKSKETYQAQGFLDSIGGVNEFFRPNRGVLSPWTGYNEATGGFNPGELSVIAARPSMGKTAWALNAVYHVATRENPTPVAFFSFEMGELAIWKRMVSLVTGIPFLRLQKGDLHATERRDAMNALAYLTKLPISVIGAGGKTASWVCGEIERLKREGKCGFALLDYIGLVKGEREGQNRNRELGDIARTFKLSAVQNKIPFTALAQLNRAPEARPDKRPMMSDLRDSGEIEEHADLIAFLFRPEYYQRDDDSLRGLAELILAKQRNGPTPIIPMRFDYRGGRFTDAEAA